tara:strand:+ start:22106 stop:22372 length:267 start_codon:yes stop_codon:yes gene_type:complete
MKKQFLNIVGAIAIGSLLLVSCSETTEAVEGANENVEHHEKEAGHSEEGHSHAAMYNCPMGCEDGKTYEEPGSCPVCNMDLVEMEHAH